MDAVVVIVVLVLAALTGWNFGEPSHISLICGVVAIGILLADFIIQWMKIGKESGHKTIANVTPPPAPAQAQAPEPIPAPVVPPKEETRSVVNLPGRIDGAPLLYQYKGVNAELLNEKVFYQAAEKELWELTPQKTDGSYHLFLLDTDAAILRDKKKEEMLDDWICRSDPYKILLDKLTPDGELTVFLAFYRDKRKGQEWREQTVTKLTDYKSEEVQNDLHGWEPGDPLDLEESNEVEGKIDVVKDCFRLGSLPSRIAKRLEDEDPWGVFVESIDLDDDGKYYVPTVRLFW